MNYLKEKTSTFWQVSKTYKISMGKKKSISQIYLTRPKISPHIFLMILNSFDLIAEGLTKSNAMPWTSFDIRQ